MATSSLHHLANTHRHYLAVMGSLPVFQMVNGLGQVTVTLAAVQCASVSMCKCVLTEEQWPNISPTSLCPR